MTKKNSIAITAALLTGATMALSVTSFGARAQSTGAPSATASAPTLPTSPAKKQLVARFLAVQQAGLEAFAASLAEQPVAEMRQPVLQAINTRVPADQRDATMKSIDGDIHKYLDEAIPILREKAVQLAPSTLGTELETHMTEEELKTLVTFYESTANKKFSQFAGEGQNQLTQKLISDTSPIIEPKIRTMQQSIGAKITAFNGPGAGAPAVPAAPASGTTK